MTAQLITVLIITIVIPLLVLISEYINYSDSMRDTFLRAGPDLCLVGLGSSGSVFIDPKVIGAFPVPSVVVLLVVLLVILIFRGLCRKLVSPPHSWRKAIGSCAFGIASIAILSCIIYYGYTRG
jgi:hypothetical protein